MLGGVAYDGMYLEYWGFLNWCDAEFRLVRWTKNSSGSWDYDRAHVNYFNDGGVHSDNHWLSCYWTDVNPPLDITIEAANVDNEGPIGTSSYVDMNVEGVYMIKRQFDVRVEPAEVKPLIGVEDSYVLKNYEPVIIVVEDLMQKLEQLPPMDEASFKAKLNDIISAYTKGKDASTLRIVVKRRESEE